MWNGFVQVVMYSKHSFGSSTYFCTCFLHFVEAVALQRARGLRVSTAILRGFETRMRKQLFYKSESQMTYSHISNTLLVIWDFETNPSLAIIILKGAPCESQMAHKVAKGKKRILVRDCPKHGRRFAAASRLLRGRFACICLHSFFLFKLICVHGHIYIYILIYTCTFVYKCIHRCTCIHRERQGEKERERERERAKRRRSTSCEN